MSDWQFVQIQTSLGKHLIMSRTGQLSQPVAILDVNDVERLIEVWEDVKR